MSERQVAGGIARANNLTAERRSEIAKIAAEKRWGTGGKVIDPVKDTRVSQTKPYWRCFHCGEVFTRAQEKHAREHFGADKTCKPVCLIRSLGEDALLHTLREAENELYRYRSEDHNMVRVLYAMKTECLMRVRRAEEEGYAKGVEDMRIIHEKEPSK